MAAHPANRGWRHAFTLTAADHDGTSVGSDTVTITNTGATDPATAGNLVISEIHYHPAGTAAEEFIELVNIGPRPIDLTGAAFTTGVQFEFSSGSIVILAPGERVLVVENRAAFEARYGTGLPIAGEFSASTRLSNSGERLILADRAGAIVSSFAFGDTLPWPPEPDGLGASLTLIRPETQPDPAVAAHWRPSRQPGGSPGENDAISIVGFPSLLEYAVTAQPTIAVDDVGTALATWTERLGADQVRVVAEFSDDLITWTPDPGDGSLWTVIDANSADGHRTLTGRFPDGALPHRYVRFRVMPR